MILVSNLHAIVEFRGTHDDRSKQNHQTAPHRARQIEHSPYYIMNGRPVPSGLSVALTAQSGEQRASVMAVS